MDSRPEEVGIKLDRELQDRVRSYASKEALTVGEALSALLYLGLEFAERQRTGLKEDLEDLLFVDRDLAYDLLWSFVRTLSGRLRETNDKMTFMAVTSKF